MKNSIELPRVYMNEGGNYPQHLGKAKVSYSQIGSFKEYKMGYLRDYILGLSTGESGIFARYGSSVGNFISEGEESEMLSEFDISVINSIDQKEGAEFESEIVIDRGAYVIQGFSDREFTENGLRYIDDFKTGNATAMLEKYGDMNKYYQTRLYAYQRENEGHQIGGCKVIHLGRKGNNTIKGDKNVLRLTGDIDHIQTPYKREDVEVYLKYVDKVAQEIAEYFKTYKKIFT